MVALLARWRSEVVWLWVGFIHWALCLRATLSFAGLGMWVNGEVWFCALGGEVSG